MQLLVALHRADGGVVSKDDLALLCWEGRIVGEDAINRVVSRLRAVAKKQGGGQFRIETITKVGYRLITSAEPSGPRYQSADSHAAPPTIERRQFILASAALGATAAGVSGWAILRQPRIPPEARILLDNARKSLREGNAGDAVNAVGTLRHAAEIAPDSAEIWGLLAFAYMLAAIDAAGQDRPGLRSRARAAMDRAFAIEPGQADALAAQVRTIPLYRNWQAYESACRAALRYHPGHPELMVELASMLAEVGRLNEALALFERVLPAMPLSTDVLTSRPFLLWSLGRMEEADTAMEQAFKLVPQNALVWDMRVTYLLLNERAHEAAAMVGDLDTRPLSNDAETFEVYEMEANALGSGDPAAIRAAVQSLVERAKTGHGYVITASVFSAFTGYLDDAFLLIDALYFNRGFRVPDVYFNRVNSAMGGERPTSFMFNRAMGALRRDPRFGAITREIGLDAYWQATGTRSRVVA